MKTKLTPALLGFLIEQNYSYMLSKTEYRQDKDILNILLTPVQAKPALETLPENYDTYFKITREPMQMAAGIEGAEVIVNLKVADARALPSFY